MFNSYSSEYFSSEYFKCLPSLNDLVVDGMLNTTNQKFKCLIVLRKRSLGRT